MFFTKEIFPIFQYRTASLSLFFMIFSIMITYKIDDFNFIGILSFMIFANICNDIHVGSYFSMSNNVKN